MKQKHLLIILLSIILLILITSVLMLIIQKNKASNDALYVCVKMNGNVVDYFRISSIESPIQKTYSSHENEYNTVEIGHDYAKVIDSNCPTRACMNMGATDENGLPIICLPHHLTITIESFHKNHIIDEVAY